MTRLFYVGGFHGIQVLDSGPDPARLVSPNSLFFLSALVLDRRMRRAGRKRETEEEALLLSLCVRHGSWSWERARNVWSGQRKTRGKVRFM
ncbi:hypothetical protein Pyn_36247 [Prunus yedoensis var. nudiflora]|uniref:Uncharacterized protein n=1 Tax=Prunus yedoensis var. nudiflora TaxID=2094558 RepID=A0A314U925_PRUYE|nr:hypothetical protein Pyn_36247 [Prunus yedoensis var. nudiflora]